MTKQTRGIDNDDMLISNSINSNGKLTQFGFSQGGVSSSENENTQQSSVRYLDGYLNRKNDEAKSIDTDLFENTSVSNEQTNGESILTEIDNKCSESENLPINDSENDSNCQEFSATIKQG